MSIEILQRSPLHTSFLPGGPCVDKKYSFVNRSEEMLSVVLILSTGPAEDQNCFSDGKNTTINQLMHQSNNWQWGIIKERFKVSPLVVFGWIIIVVSCFYDETSSLKQLWWIYAA